MSTNPRDPFTYPDPADVAQHQAAREAALERRKQRGNVNPLVHAFFAQQPKRTRAARTSSASTTPSGWKPPEWQGCACSIGATQAGRMYCAMHCDGAGCGAEATPERLADFARYDAARRANNRTAAQEERRYRGRRKALAGEDKRFRHSEDEEEAA